MRVATDVNYRYCVSERVKKERGRGGVIQPVGESVSECERAILFLWPPGIDNTLFHCVIVQLCCV